MPIAGPHPRPPGPPRRRREGHARPDRRRGSRGHRPLSEAAPRGPVRQPRTTIRQVITGTGMRLPGQPSSVVTDARGPIPTGRHRPRPDRRHRRRGADDPERHDHRDDPQCPRRSPRRRMLFAAQDGLRRDLRPPHPARPGVDRRRPRQADQAAAGRREGRRQGDERPHDHRRRGRYTLPGFPKGKSYGLMVLAGREASVFRDRRRRARYRRPRSAPGRRRVRAGHPDAAQADRQGDGQGTPSGRMSPTGRCTPTRMSARSPAVRRCRGSGAYSVGVLQDGWELPPGRPARPGGRGRPHGRGQVPAGLRRSRAFFNVKGPRRTDEQIGSTAIGTASSSPHGETASAACRRSSTAPSSWSIPPRAPAPSPPRPCSSATASARSACSAPTANAAGRRDRRGRAEPKADARRPA